MKKSVHFFLGIQAMPGFLVFDARFILTLVRCHVIPMGCAIGIPQDAPGVSHWNANVILMACPVGDPIKISHGTVVVGHV